MTFSANTRADARELRIEAYAHFCALFEIVANGRIAAANGRVCARTSCTDRVADCVVLDARAHAILMCVDDDPTAVDNRFARDHSAHA
jgi:hypothetical protein